MAEQLAEYNESKKRHTILKKYLGTSYYHNGHLHNAIEDAMKEYAASIAIDQDGNTTKYYEWLLQKGYRMRNGKIIKYPSLEEISDSEAEALQNEYQAKVR